MARLPAAELYRMSQSVHWWHSLPLGDGFVTQGVKPRTLAEELRAWQFPTDLTGKTVLDIGCNDGGFSIAALDRGASQVVSIDAITSDGMRFLLDHEVYPLDFRQMDLFSPEFMALPAFDFVICAGVIYHVHDPVAALKRVRHVTRGMALVSSILDERVSHLPCMRFYEGDEIYGDPTTWWGPNRRCLEAMIRTAGFKILLVGECDTDPGTKLGGATYYVAPT